MITIEVNQKKIELDDTACLKDALKKAKPFYIQGSTIGILKKTEKTKQETSEYKILTTKGEFEIEITDNIGLWDEILNKLKNIKAHWSTNDSIAFGPFELDFIPKKGERKYSKNDIIIGTGGYDSKTSYLLFSKNKHVSDYGGPQKAIIGKIISGVKLFSSLKQGDVIKDIEPIIKWESLVNKECVTDLNYKLEDGMKIYTYFKVQLFDQAPEGAEHFLGMTRKNLFNIDTFTNTFVSDDRLLGEGCIYEHWASRSEGTVTVRTSGQGNGRVYIYKEDRTSSSAHSVVGKVSEGIELLKIAEKGNKLSVISDPERVLIIGKTFDEAEEFLKERGITLEKTGYTGEDAIIVEQNPDTTIEIINSKKVIGLGVKSDKIINVKFYDNLAPKTLDFFRHSLRLKDRPLGALPVYFTYADTYLFRAEKGAESYKELIPENTPKSVVKAGELGVTNQAAKRYGMIGVRLVDDKRFGPTGEKFECTNIIGKILEPERVKNIKEGDIIYIREVS